MPGPTYTVRLEGGPLDGQDYEIHGGLPGIVIPPEQGGRHRYETTRTNDARGLPVFRFMAPPEPPRSNVIRFPRRR